MNEEFTRKILNVNISLLFFITLFIFLTLVFLFSMVEQIHILFPDKIYPIILKYLFIFIISLNFLISIGYGTHILLPEYNKYLKLKIQKSK